MAEVWDWLVGLKYDSKWDALLTAKLEKQFSDRTSDSEDDSTSLVCEDKFESKSNTNGTQISQKHQLYQTFYDTWIKEVLRE